MINTALGYKELRQMAKRAQKEGEMFMDTVPKKKHRPHMIVENALFTIWEEINRLYGKQHKVFNKDCACCKIHKLMEQLEQAMDFRSIE